MPDVSTQPAPDHPMTRLQPALTALAAGRPVLVVGEHGGDLVVSAATASAPDIAFMVRHTGGFLTVAVRGEDADRLDLPLQRPDAGASGPCVAVDAAEGITTGISAADRARTIRLLADAGTAATDLQRPGHVIPERAVAGGCSEHPGATEVAVDLARLAGVAPAAARSGLVSPVDPVQMADAQECLDFAAQHQLTVAHAADVIAACRAGQQDRLPTHAVCLTGDLLGSTGCGCRAHLDTVLARVLTSGQDVLLRLTPPVETALPRPVHPQSAAAHT